MFYFNEIWSRVFYLLFYYIMLLFLCFFYKHLFFYFFSVPILKTTNHLIYTNPIEFIMSYFFMILLVSFCFYAFYAFWQILDFLKAGLYVYEYKLYCKTLYKGISFIYLFNLFIVYFFLPYTWNSFESFNFYLNKINTLNFFLELKVLDYLNFLHYNLITLNSVLFLLLFFSFFNLQFFILFKKFYCLFNFLFSTLFSTTDLYSQCCFLFALQLLFELYIVLNVLIYKFNKNLRVFTKNY